MLTKKPWGSCRVVFFSLKDEIEDDLLKAIPKKTIWEKHSSVLNCSYANFTQLCNKYIGKKLVSFTTTDAKEQKVSREVISERIEPPSKPRSMRSTLTGTKINFTPTPDPERVSRWFTKPKK